MYTVEQRLVGKIGFMNWAKLHPSDCEDLMMWCHGYQGEVFLSPDVRSLHILWTDLESNEIYHEIADYPDGLTIKEFLDAEVLEDSFEIIEGAGNVYDVMSDYKIWTPENVPVIRVADLSSWPLLSQ